MPVAVKLSREFYERFGNEVTTEFVEVLNQVDASYRSELGVLFDAQTARLEARLEARMDARFSAVDGRFVSMDARFAAIDARFVQIDARFDQFRAEIRADLQSLKSELLKWMFLFWTGTVGLVVALIGFLRP